MSDPTKRERISRLLIVEDDQSQLRTLTDLMGEEGFEVIACETVAEALEQLEDPDFSVAIVDLRLPDRGGTELLEQMRRLNGKVQVIIHTGYGSYDSAKEALNLGAFAYVEKLSDPSELIGHVHRAFLEGMNRYADELEAAVAEQTAELTKSNANLRQQITERKKLETALRKANEDLEARVAERTFELSEANASLHKEITERKEAERRHQEAEKRYRTLFDQLPDAVVLIDPNTMLPIEFNDLAPRLLGYSPEEFAKLRVADYDANENAEQAREHTERVLRDGGDEFETRMRTKDGSIRDVLVRVRVAEISGRPVLHSIFRDITERRQAEEEIRRLATALEAAGEAAVITDMHGTIEYVNPGFTKLYGFSRDQALGQTPRILRSGQHDPAFYEQLWATITARRVWRGEIINCCADGTLIEVEVTIAPVCSASGKLTGYVSLARDISERKEAQARAHQQEAEMARMARMSTLGELAAGIAHEVNQPLAAIVNFTGAALQRVRAGDARSDELCRTLEQTADMAERAGKIIHRIKDLVGHRQPHRSTTEVNELVRDALSYVSEDLRIQDVSLRLELTENLPPVSVDAIQIQQVILNLVHNAVEALRQPGLTKRHLLLRTQRSEGGVEVVVEDTGPGISPRVADRLFEPFVTTKGEGLGMGLPISASIIQAHNGRLWNTAHEDGRTAFHFMLPTMQQESES